MKGAIHKITVIPVCRKKIAGCLACEYEHSFLSYLKLEDMGIYTAYGKENKAEEKLKELYQFGKSLE